MSEAFRREAKDLIVIVPILHISLCAIFMMAYFFNFGRGAFFFSSPLDFFYVSVKEIGPSYLSFCLFASAYFIYHRGHYGAFTKDDYISKLPEDKKAATIARFNQDRRFWQWGLAITLAVSFSSTIIRWVIDDAFPFFLMVQPLAIILSYCLGWASSKIGWSFWTYQLAWALSYLVFVTAVRGLDVGQSDRYMSYSEAALSKPRCKEGVLLRPLADNYLLISRDNRHYLADKDCHRSFVFPQAGKLHKRKLSDFEPPDNYVVLARVFLGIGG